MVQDCKHNTYRRTDTGPIHVHMQGNNEKSHKCTILGQHVVNFPLQGTLMTVNSLKVRHVGEVEARHTQADGYTTEHEQVVRPGILLTVCQAVAKRYPILKNIKLQFVHNCGYRMCVNTWYITNTIGNNGYIQYHQHTHGTSM